MAIQTLSPSQNQLLPRLIRLRDAPFYLGMDKNRFNQLVRPELTEIPIGDQGIAFDRLELDQWVDYYIQRNGRPATKGARPWDVKIPQDSTYAKESGILINKSKDMADFAKAVKQVTGKKRNKS